MLLEKVTGYKGGFSIQTGEHPCGIRAPLPGASGYLVSQLPKEHPCRSVVETVLFGKDLVLS